MKIGGITVDAEVYDQELGDLAATVLQRAVWSEKYVNQRTTLHSDSNNVSAIFYCVNYSLIVHAGMMVPIMYRTF